MCKYFDVVKQGGQEVPKNLSRLQGAPIFLVAICSQRNWAYNSVYITVVWYSDPMYPTIHCPIWSRITPATPPLC